MKTSKILLLFSFFFYTTVYADTVNVPIDIKADRMVLYIESGNNIFQGNVTIQRGEIILNGDTVTLINKSNAFEQIEITGSPATYQQKGDKDTISASSNEMEYSTDSNTLTLIGNAKLVQPDSTLESDRIVYDTDKKIIMGGNTQDSGERVNIKIEAEH